MCKTATAVQERTVKAVSGFWRTVFRNIKRNRGGGGSVHVWAGTTQFNKTDLVILSGNVNARRYIDNVLRPVALPFLRQNYRRPT